MKNKLMMLVLLASLNSALVAQEDQPEEPQDVHAACKQQDIRNQKTIGNYREEIAGLRDDFAEEIARLKAKDFRPEDLLSFFAARIDGMSLATFNGLSFKNLFVSEINIDNLKSEDLLVSEPEFKKMLFLFFLVTKNMPGIKITLEDNEALQLFARFKPATCKALLDRKLVTLKEPTFYDRHSFKIKIAAFISLCIFLYKYRDTFFNDDSVIKEKLERLIAKLISVFKTYAAPKLVFAGIAAKGAYEYLSNSTVLEPVRKYFSKN